MDKSFNVGNKLLLISISYFVIHGFFRLVFGWVVGISGDDTVDNTTVLIVADAAYLAFIFSVFSYWPGLGGLLYPYHKESNRETAGFLPLKYFIRSSAFIALNAFQRFIFPLWATFYLFLVMVLEYLARPIGAVPENYYFGIPIIWVIAMFMAGRIWLVLFAGILFGIGYLISQTVYGGYLAVIVIASIFFSSSLIENFWIDSSLLKLELETTRTLEGERKGGVGRFISQLSSIRWLAQLFMIGFTIYSFLENSTLSFQDLLLRYTPKEDMSIGNTLVMLIIFSNVSWKVFGGIYSYLQLDFFSLLSNMVHAKTDSVNKPEQNEEETPSNKQSEETLTKEEISTEDENTAVIQYSPRDCVLVPINYAPSYNYNIALFFFCLDLVLTSATVLQIPIFPGLTVQEIGVLSTVLKIPVMVIFGLRMVSSIMQYLVIKGVIKFNSESTEEIIEQERERRKDLYRLLQEIQTQQIGHTPYIDVRKNSFLLKLAASPKETERRQSV